MKYKSKIGCFQVVCFLLLATAFYSCSQEEPMRSGSEERKELPTPLRVGSAGRGGIATRADGDTQLLDQPTDRIGIFLMADEKKGYQAVSNKLYTYATPHWESEGNLMLAGETAQLAAYYPYDAKGSNPALLVSQVYDAGKEFYYLPFTANNTNSTINLNLRRAYALLRFNCIKGIDETGTGQGTYIGEGKITAFGFTAPLLQVGMLDLFTGKVNESVQAPITLSYNGAPFTAGSTAAPTKVDFLVIPSDMSAFTDDMTFDLMADGKEMKNGRLALTALCGDDKKLLEGTKYEINITLRPSGLEVDEVKIEDWIPEEIADSGNKPFVPDPQPRIK